MFRRPLLVTAVALVPFGLGLWYLVFTAGALVLLAGAAASPGWMSLPPDVRFGPAILAGAGLLAAAWAFSTAGALRRGRAWGRLSVLLLTLFALPWGFPSDVYLTGAVGLVLFLPRGARQYFR